MTLTPLTPSTDPLAALTMPVSAPFVTSSIDAYIYTSPGGTGKLIQVSLVFYPAWPLPFPLPTKILSHCLKPHLHLKFSANRPNVTGPCSSSLLSIATLISFSPKRLLRVKCFTAIITA